MANAIGPGATRTTPEQIDGYLDAILAALDLDLDADPDALTDGLLALRYLFGFRGATLIANAIGPSAQRDTAMEVEDYVELLVP